MKARWFGWLCFVLLIPALAGCAPSSQKLATLRFPVAEPFALDQAGSKVTVEFDLPDTRENGKLRPVFVGFRAIDMGGGRTPDQIKLSSSVIDYLDEKPIPIRLRVWRLENGQRVSVGLSDMRRDIVARRYWYEAHPEDVFTHHFADNIDNDEMIAIGRYDFSKAYYVHKIARIIPPTPGHYVLEAESLETHSTLYAGPLLPDLRYEVLVSHHYHHGID